EVPAALQQLADDQHRPAFVQQLHRLGHRGELAVANHRAPLPGGCGPSRGYGGDGPLPTTELVAADYRSRSGRGRAAGSMLASRSGPTGRNGADTRRREMTAVTQPGSLGEQKPTGPMTVHTVQGGGGVRLHGRGWGRPGGPP